MTDTVQTPATIVQQQLADVLVAVPLPVCAAMSDRDKFRALEWVEMVRECTSGMFHVPLPEICAVRECLSQQQRLGSWESFTTWRPAAVRPRQRELL